MAGITLGSILFYLYFAAGSVSLGYLLLRLVYPELRLQEQNQKLGMSAVVGFLLALGAFVADYLFDGTDVFTRQGFFPLVLFLLSVAAFLVLKLYFLITQGSFLTVGIPVSSGIGVLPSSPKASPTSAIAVPGTPPAAKPAARGTAPAGTPPWMARAQESRRETKPLLADLAPSKSKDLAFQSPSDRLRHLKDAYQTLKPGSELSGFPEIPRPGENEEPEPGARESRAKKAIEIAPQPAQPEPAAKASGQELIPELSRIPEARKTPDTAAPPAASAEKDRIPIVKPAPVQGPIRSSFPVAAATPAAPKADESSEKKRKVILMLKKQETVVEPQPPSGGLGGFFASLTGGTKPAQAQKREPERPKLERPTSLLSSPAPSPFLRARERPAQNDEPVLPPVKAQKEEAPAKGHLASITRIVKETREPSAQAPQSEDRPLEFKASREEQRAGRKSGALKEITAAGEEPAPEAPAEEPSPSASDENVIHTYRGIRHVHGGPQAASGPAPEEEEFARDLVSSKMAAEEAGRAEKSRAGEPGAPAGKVMVHRRYMLSADGKHEDVSVIAPKAATEKENFDYLVQDVYEQLKTSQRAEGLAKKLAPENPPHASLAPEKPASSMVLQDLAREQQKPKPDTSALFAQLREMADKKEQPIAFVKVEAQKTMGCPTCHSKSSRIIFCPFCGKGLCANCSPKVQPFKEKFVYQCPNCKEDVEVQRKAAAPS